MSSTRLPGKVLAQAHGRPLLSVMLERVAAARSLDGFSVATSLDPSDDPIADYCKENQIPFFRGNLNDVLDRYYQAAVSLPARPDVIVRLTADCPLMDPRVIDQVVDTFLSGASDGGWDYVANTVPPEGATFPDGMDVEVFSMTALETAWREAKLQPEREHVTFYLWKSGRFRTHRVDRSPALANYRLTVDYPEDLELVRGILEALYPRDASFTMEAIVEHLERNPALLDLNAGYRRNEGWNRPASPTP